MYVSFQIYKRNKYITVIKASIRVSFLILKVYITVQFFGSILICHHPIGQIFSYIFRNKHSVSISIQSLSHVQLCDPMDCSTPGFPGHHQLPEFTQTHVHWVSDAIQSSHPLSSPSPPAFNLSQHQGLFQWVSFSHQAVKVLEFQFQHQSFQWTPRTDLL